MATDFVVDNSVVMAWCFDDEVDEYADGVLRSLNAYEALVPSVWPLEVGNALVVAERRGRLSRAALARFVALLSELPIAVEWESTERALNEIVALAREHRLSTYDASYLDLAMRLGLPLATRDGALAVAMQRCGVAAYVPPDEGE